MEFMEIYNDLYEDFFNFLDISKLALQKFLMNVKMTGFGIKDLSLFLDYVFQELFLFNSI